MLGLIARWAARLHRAEGAPPARCGQPKRHDTEPTLRREPVLAITAAADSMPALVQEVEPAHRERQPAVSRYRDADLEQRPVGAHALALCKWLADLPPVHTDETPDGEVQWVLARDVVDAYGEMCAEAGWAMHAWQCVGHEMRQRFGFSKRYRWVRDRVTGRRHRLCVYPRVLSLAGSGAAGASVAHEATAPGHRREAARGCEVGTRSAQEKRAA